MLYRNRILKGGVAASVAVAIAASATAFAAAAETTVPVTAPTASEAPMTDAKMAMPYPGPTAFEYVLPEKAKDKFESAAKALYAVKCDTKKALASAGISSSGKEIVSFSVANGEYEESYDLKNCSMSLYRTKNSYWNETLTKEEALASAKSFFDKEIAGRGASYGEFGKPRATANGGYGIAVPYASKDAVTTSYVPEEVVIEDDGGGDVPVLKEATGYSVFYPYLLKGVPLYDSYGNELGVRMEVGATGVNSASVPLLKFKLAKRTSEKMSAEDFEAFVKRGGNSPYYGSEGGKVELSEGTFAFATVQLWRGGRTETYLSTATRFASGKKNPYQDSEYGIVVPHFSIGDSQKQ